MSSNRSLRRLLRPPPLRWFKSIVTLYASFAVAAAALALLIYPIFADTRPWSQKLAFYLPPIVLGALLGSPALRTGVRWVVDLTNRRSPGRAFETIAGEPL